MAMGRSALVLLAAGLFFHNASAASLSLSGGGNPVSKVATLLENLASKIDAELDAESDLYDSYVCWSNKVISDKTASNSAAQSRVDSLEKYLDDLKAGRVVLTSEGGDVTKQIASTLSDLEKSANMRKNENDAYTKGSAENDKGIAALGKAVTNLEAGMKTKKQTLLEAKKGKAGLLSFRAEVHEAMEAGESMGFQERVAMAAEMEEAARVASQYLSEGNALFLKRVLLGEVPKPDWKKVNRKAGFKMQYKARSTKIMGMLTKLVSNFNKNKAEMDANEAKSLSDYNTLKTSKEAELTAARTAQTSAAVEKGAAAVVKADSDEEIKSLKQQIADDTKSINDTKSALATKKAEYVTRAGLRHG